MKEEIDERTMEVKKSLIRKNHEYRNILHKVNHLNLIFDKIDNNYLETNCIQMNLGKQIDKSFIDKTINLKQEYENSPNIVISVKDFEVHFKNKEEENNIFFNVEIKNIKNTYFDIIINIDSGKNNILFKVEDDNETTKLKNFINICYIAISNN